MVFLYIPNIGLLQHSQHPETAMNQTPEEEVQKIENNTVSCIKGEISNNCQRHYT